ncbi:MAG: hypothetical protein GXP30_02335 [Verrucomicrobia bacterium]|nr:hypothetical protein [Verrucomicrobiota bacterium]
MKVLAIADHHYTLKQWDWVKRAVEQHSGIPDAAQISAMGFMLYSKVERR